MRFFLSSISLALTLAFFIVPASRAYDTNDSSDTSAGPSIIINGDAQVAPRPQQIFVPKSYNSFDSAPLSNNFLGGYGASPYRWLGATAPISPIFGTAFAGPALTPIYGGGYGNAFSSGFGGGFGAIRALTALGGFGGFGGGSYYPMGFGHYGGFGNYGGFGSIPGLTYGGLGFGSMGGYGGFGNLGGYGGYGAMGGYGGWGNFGGMGMGGMGMGMGTSPEFGRLTNTTVIQTEPSKPSGNYYAPSTVDSSASGSYYANPGGATLAFPTKRQNSNQNYTKPQTNYWGGGGSPFGKDLNSVPWAK